MAKAIFTNNATGALSSPIASTGATTLVLGAGQGALFPVPTGGNYFYATIVDASNNKEIVKVTDNTADTFTMVRAQEGTAARTFLSGCKVEHRVTAAGLNEKLTAADLATSLTTTVQLLTSGSGATYTPTAGAQWIKVTIKAGGGGGSGVGTTNPNNSAAGGNSSFDDGGTPIVAVGGGRGNSIVGPGVGGTGGSGTANYRIPGAPGNTPASLVEGGNARTFGGSGGGQGGSIGGPGFATAAASTAFNGGGGGGGSIGLQSFASLASWYVGFGGGEGETAVIWLPAASYTYTVGGGGSAGTSGTSGAQGGQGGNGIIIVEEYYL